MEFNIDYTLDYLDTLGFNVTKQIFDERKSNFIPLQIWLASFIVELEQEEGEYDVLP